MLSIQIIVALSWFKYGSGMQKIVIIFPTGLTLGLVSLYRVFLVTVSFGIGGSCCRVASFLYFLLILQ